MIGEWPEGWIPLESGAAIHRDDCTPCRCGATRLAVTRRAAPSDDGARRVVSGVQCGACVRLRRDETIVGSLDTTTKELMYR